HTTPPVLNSNGSRNDCRFCFCSPELRRPGSRRRCLFRPLPTPRTHMRFIRVTPLVVAASLILTGCATDSGQTRNPEIPVSTSTTQLRPGDSLNIAVQGVPDATTHALQIDEQGSISLPFIG